MIKCLSLSLGYAESARLGIVLFIHEVGFKTINEAVESLAGVLFKKFNDNEIKFFKHKKTCCLEVRDQTAFFCPKCGNRIKDSTIEPVHFENYLTQILTTDNDGFGYSDLRDEDDYEWETVNCLSNIMNYKKKELADIMYYAEKVLTANVPQSLLSEESKSLFVLYKTTLNAAYKASPIR